MVPQETIIDEGSLTDEENDSDYIPIKQGVQIRISTSSIESGSFTQNSASNDLDPSVHDQRIHDKSNNQDQIKAKYENTRVLEMAANLATVRAQLSWVYSQGCQEFASEQLNEKKRIISQQLRDQYSDNFGLQKSNQEDAVTAGEILEFGDALERDNKSSECQQEDLNTDMLRTSSNNQVMEAETNAEGCYSNPNTNSTQNSNRNDAWPATATNKPTKLTRIQNPAEKRTSQLPPTRQDSLEEIIENQKKQLISGKKDSQGQKGDQSKKQFGCACCTSASCPVF